MNFNEAAVFRWVLIFGAAGASVFLVVLLTDNELVGALWGLVLALVGCAYGIRRLRDWWRRGRPPGD